MWSFPTALRLPGDSCLPWWQPFSKRGLGVVLAQLGFEVLCTGLQAFVARAFAAASARADAEEDLEFVTPWTSPNKTNFLPVRVTRVFVGAL